MAQRLEQLVASEAAQGIAKLTSLFGRPSPTRSGCRSRSRRGVLPRRANDRLVQLTSLEIAPLDEDVVQVTPALALDPLALAELVRRETSCGQELRAEGLGVAAAN
jgi:hypothetical protein